MVLISSVVVVDKIQCRENAEFLSFRLQDFSLFFVFTKCVFPKSENAISVESPIERRGGKF